MDRGVVEAQPKTRRIITDGLFLLLFMATTCAHANGSTIAHRQLLTLRHLFHSLFSPAINDAAAPSGALTATRKTCFLSPPPVFRRSTSGALNPYDVKSQI